MKYVLVALSVGLGFDAGPAFAYCDEPDAPYCASRFGGFDDEYEFDRCRREMQSFRDEVEEILECLQGEVNDAQQAANEAIREAQNVESSARSQADDATSEYESAVQSFNRRANY
ncbi:hypothetical protein [Mesorhizobium marinum]|uniref:hypothetical protein n=1 Tax=Mesorhizobium marinum TaxID=3228790 RepID=UPI003464F745